MFGIPLERLNFNERCRYDIRGMWVCDKEDVIVTEEEGGGRCMAYVGEECMPREPGYCCVGNCLPVVQEEGYDWNKFTCQVSRASGFA